MVMMIARAPAGIALMKVLPAPGPAWPGQGVPVARPARLGESLVIIWIYQRSLDVIAERGTGVCCLQPGSRLAGMLAFIAWPDPQELAYPLGCAAVNSGLDQREYCALHAGGQQDLPQPYVPRRALCPTPSGAPLQSAEAI